MKLINSLEDDQYPFEGVDQTRKVVRAIVFNQNHEICLEKVVRDDRFGKFEYYETPGGGVEEDETLEEALLRELDEEIGYQCEIICEFGEVDDYYNLIKRKNLNYYFLCKARKKTKIHHESHGDSFIKNVKFYSLEEIIAKYESMDDNGVPLLVKRRELPLFKILKEINDDDQKKKGE
jgi:8-oxo-dGTP pyrophosphatase MutT (NUDIX family)